MIKRWRATTAAEPSVGSGASQDKQQSQGGDALLDGALYSVSGEEAAGEVVPFKDGGKGAEVREPTEAESKVQAPPKVQPGRRLRRRPDKGHPVPKLKELRHEYERSRGVWWWLIGRVVVGTVVAALGSLLAWIAHDILVELTSYATFIKWVVIALTAVGLGTWIVRM